MDYKYKIGDKTYYQKPLVLGQIKQLEEFLKGSTIPQSLNVTTLMSLLGDKIPYALAIVLIEEGKSLSDRFHLSEIRNPQSEITGVVNSPLGRGAGVGNFGYEPLPETMNMIAMEIATNIDLETTAQAIEDFFVCNPTASFFQRLSGIINSLGLNPSPAQIGDQKSNPRSSRGQNPKSEAGLTKSASSSPEETSPDETTSSGDIPLPNADRILNTASAT